MKPDIVFFGEELPASYDAAVIPDLASADLFVAIGTSMRVRPAGAMLEGLRPGVPALLINAEPLRTASKGAFDLTLVGQCDVICAALAARVKGLAADIDGHRTAALVPPAAASSSSTSSAASWADRTLRLSGAAGALQPTAWSLLHPSGLPSSAPASDTIETTAPAALAAAASASAAVPAGTDAADVGSRLPAAPGAPRRRSGRQRSAAPPKSAAVALAEASIRLSAALATARAEVAAKAAVINRASDAATATAELDASQDAAMGCVVKIQLPPA